MSPHKSIPMLRIKSCSDPQRWYSNLVGRNVPQLGYDPVSGWKSKEPAGYTNFILTQDAEGIVSLVPEYLLGRWPYITHDTLAAQHAQVKPAPKPPPPRAVTGRCEKLVFGRLPEIEPGIVATEERICTPAGQSRTHSMAETMANIVVGFAASMVIQALVLPAMGHDITLAQNFWITCIFTVASVVRGYGIRRIFNRFQTNGAQGDGRLLQRD